MVDWLADYPVCVELAVCWGEMDAYQHVNNSVYFRYFENARLEYFRQLGGFNLGKPVGVGPIVASTEARFRKPLTYPDTIRVGCRVAELGADRFVLEHTIVSLSQQAIVTEGKGLVIMYDYDRKQKAPVSDDLRRRIEMLESKRVDSRTEPGTA